MTTKGYKTATLRGLRLYGIPSMLVDTLRDADAASLLSDQDWRDLGQTTGSAVKDIAYKIGLRPEVCAAHAKALSVEESN